jgi:hypothetical protein
MIHDHGLLIAFGAACFIAGMVVCALLILLWEATSDHSAHRGYYDNQGKFHRHHD